ncbi:MAG: hypothetical protein CMJ18_23475 [Phycisphaeraceae bacterium]|nr:hypothetical protein [Phycisphaeraceae bacterium]
MKCHASSRNHQPFFEPLESRVLLSGDGLADLEPGPVAPNGIVFRMVGVDNDTDPDDSANALTVDFAGAVSDPSEDANVDPLIADIMAEDMPTPNSGNSVWDDSPMAHVVAEAPPEVTTDPSNSASGLPRQGDIYPDVGDLFRSSHSRPDILL